MAGQLVQVATETVSSPVSSVTLTGIDSDDVYMVAMNNVVPSNDTQLVQVRVTESGTPNSTSNYDYAYKQMKGNTTFSNGSSTNQSYWFIFSYTGTGANESTNGLMYLYNFNNASEYSFCTLEQSFTNNDSNLRGFQGGAVLTVAQSTDGINFFMSSGNIDTGSTFTLYGLKK